MRKFFLRVSDKEQGLEQAARDLLAGRCRDDVLEDSIRALEQDAADDSVGFGGFPNLLGAMELDAAFMDGDSRNCGAVGGVASFLPVRIARSLMKQGLHTMLLGEGAEIFAREAGFHPEPTLSASQLEKWQREIRPLVDARGSRTLMDVVRRIAVPETRNCDTTVMIASDGTGLSGAASTSGWPYKHPGRIGDTPIVGAGLYVDSRFGGSCATWTGEMSTRAGAARLVVSELTLGKSPRAAVHAAIQDLSALRGGLLRSLVIHAIDCDGEAHVAAVNSRAPIYYHYWREDGSNVERREAEAVSVSFAPVD